MFYSINSLHYSSFIQEHIFFLDVDDEDDGLGNNNDLVTFFSDFLDTFFLTCLLVSYCHMHTVSNTLTQDTATLLLDILL